MSQQLTERQQWILSSPQTVRQLVLETHAYESKIKEQEAAGATKDALTSMWLEIVTRKDKIKNLVGQAYVTPKLVHRSEKSVLNDLFRGLSGFTWAKSFGWVGQSKTPVRLEVQILEAPPDLYDCVVTKHITNPAVEETEIVSLELNGSIILESEFSVFNQHLFICR